VPWPTITSASPLDSVHYTAASAACIYKLLPAGTLDVNSLVRALTNLNAPPTHSGLSINTAAAAAEMAGQVNVHTPHAQHAGNNHNNAGNSPTHGLAAPAPLVLGSPTAAAAAAVAAGHMAAGNAAAVPATPHAAAAASQLLALQQQQQGGEGMGDLCGSMGGDRSAADVLPGLVDATGGTANTAGGTVGCNSPLSGEHTEATLPMSLLSAQYSHISSNSTAALQSAGLISQHGSATQMQIAMSKYAAAAAAAGGDVGAAAGLGSGYGGMPGLPDLGLEHGGAGAAVFAGLEGYMLGAGGGGVQGSGPCCITTGAQE
jgi:hypothetical protein